jgi:predicted alpha-1,6-mannanase (GH76 family)
VQPPVGTGGDLFYDDNAWAGLALVQMYRLTGDPMALQRAIQSFAFVVSGWDSDSTHRPNGGVFWVKSPWNRDRSVVSSGSGAELGLQLHELTGGTNPSYLEWSRRMYDWTRTYLRAPDNLYWDHVDLQGNVEDSQWSYNQGAMIGAGVMFYRVTGDATYLRQARATADAAMRLFSSKDQLSTQSPAFNAIYFRNLMLLQAETDDASYRAVMQQYADALWRSRDPATGLLRSDPNGPFRLLDQSALVQIHALLAWPPTQYRKLA